MEKIRTFLLLGLILALSQAAGFCEGPYPTRTLTLGQERLEAGGVLISRPKAFDERIKNIAISQKIYDIDDYAGWLKRNLRYVAEEGTNIWLKPQETLANKCGDCEDLAFLNRTFLEVLGFKPEVLGLLRQPQSHAICVFKEGETYSVIDNTRLHRTPARTREELARYLFSHYRCGSIARLRFETKNWDILFRRSDCMV